MLNEARKLQLKTICQQFLDDELFDYNALTTEEVHYISYLIMNNFNAKSEKKEEIMNKYLVITNDGLAKYCKDIVEAKESATEAVLAGHDEVCVYELKMTAGVVKPKVEFKEA